VTGAPHPEGDALAVLSLIQRLPEAYRETLVLRLVEGMTGPEIAERTGLKPGSVRVNLHRGLQFLREAPRERDALSLWHLLTRVEGDDRARIFDRLQALVPAPAGVTRDGALRGERAMRERWWDALGLGSSSFWRMWTGAWSDATPPPAGDER
jgi:hypothetical protein